MYEEVLVFSEDDEVVAVGFGLEVRAGSEEHALRKLVGKLVETRSTDGAD